MSSRGRRTHEQLTANHLVALAGLPRQAWLTDPDLALAAVVMADVWQWTPLVFLVCRYFRFDGATWGRSAAVHLPCSLLFGALWTFMRWGLSFVPAIDRSEMGKVSRRRLREQFLDTAADASAVQG